jgi:NAD(P)-dependent dehydrogenase (short-subunit alcohol dehydrogenase family)
MPEWTLRGRTFLITGGARGIGAATARDCARPGGAAGPRRPRRRRPGAALHTPVAERQMIHSGPEVLAAYERDARERGAEDASASERTRTVLAGREREPAG